MVWITPILLARWAMVGQWPACSLKLVVDDENLILRRDYVGNSQALRILEPRSSRTAFFGHASTQVPQRTRKRSANRRFGFISGRIDTRDRLSRRCRTDAGRLRIGKSVDPSADSHNHAFFYERVEHIPRNPVANRFAHSKLPADG
jgi:hypothetical protein